MMEANVRHINFGLRVLIFHNCGKSGVQERFLCQICMLPLASCNDTSIVDLLWVGGM